MLRYLPRFRARHGWRLGCVSLILAGVTIVATAGGVPPDPAWAANVVCRYDFEHPVGGAVGWERDLGAGGVAIQLINGGGAQRSGDGAFPASAGSLLTKQINPTMAGNDDWKAGVYSVGGVPGLARFGGVAGITLMGWVKRTGEGPALDSTTASPTDKFNAIGLYGLLSGDSDGHGVRALVEVINVGTTLRLVALGRRIDGGASLTLAADQDWTALLPLDTWVHLAATFDYDAGVMALYRDGQPLAATYTTSGDAWGVVGGVEPDLTSPTVPRGIKIGGSYPQNTVERNPFPGRFDELVFVDRVLTSAEIAAQFGRYVASAPAALPALQLAPMNGAWQLSWPSPAADFGLERTANLTAGDWQAVTTPPGDDGEVRSVVVPRAGDAEFFRLRKP
jgi:Concanavalin A-like lectin/glucanases superfamily